MPIPDAHAQIRRSNSPSDSPKSGEPATTRTACGCQLFAHLDSVIGSGYVTPHTLIGRMGNTGIGSHGLHLHWEIRKKGGCERSTSGIFVIRIATNETELNKYWVNPHDYNPNYFRNHHIWDIE